jgi:pyrimidine-nucleoside phosphorylase
MVVARLIERKRNGGALTPEEWGTLLTAYTAGQVPDYQMSALLMAVCFQGLTPAELAAMTTAMLDSGIRWPRGAGNRLRVDKHSTGGVGDKTSLLLAPLLAACGVAVPMMSGRGLGHTGGTLDKLESIPGFRTDLSIDVAQRQLERLGVAMIGQTDEIVPADRKLYALRDVTGTVESMPLITASIMSKKLAEQLDGLVLDVKVGSGAFIPEPERARELAEMMVATGEQGGCRTVAVLTAMDRPLGRACGNALEVREAIAGLRGEAPGDLMEVTLALGAEMLLLGRGADDHEGAVRRLRRTIAAGTALERLQALIEAQGGDPAVVEDPTRLPVAPWQREVSATHDGRFPPLDPRRLGEVIVMLGGGRRTAEDRVDPAVGLEVLPRAGQRVRGGEPVVRIHARTEAALVEAELAVARELEAASRLGHQPLPLVLRRITAADLPQGGT